MLKKLYRVLYIFLVAALLSSCAVNTPPKPQRQTFTLILKDNVQFMDPKVLGSATYLPFTSTCVVHLRQYPQCLLHEIRHCFEGNWHPNRTSDEDCY